MIGIGSSIGFSKPRLLSEKIKALFSQGEKGIHYDFSDISTLYQDNTGTTPVTAVGQAVGLVLDKSQGLVLGPELVTNAADREFTSDTGYWIKAGCTIDNGSIHVVDATGATGSNFQRASMLTVGKGYTVTFDIVDSTAGSIKVNGGTLISGVGSKSTTFIAAVTELVFFRGAGVTDLRIDNISVRELPGYHATQSTSTARPILARHPITGRRNLLTYTEDFSNAVWVKAAATVATGNVFTATTGAAVHRISSASVSTPTAPCVVWIDAKAGTHGFLQIANGASLNHYANFDLSTGVVGAKGSAASSSSIVDMGSGVYRCVAVWSGTPNANNMLHIVSSESAAWSESWTAIGTETIELVKAQVELGSTPTAYQKVTSTYDVTEAGVNGAYYLAFDGVDDYLVTPSINFTGTDKMSVFAGVRKLSDAATGMLAELSTIVDTNNGSFAIKAPGASGANKIGLETRGSALSQSAAYTTGFAAPATGVITTQSGISTDQQTVRLNGAQVASSSQDLGTGNFGNYPLYIGMRAGTSLPFNGHLYSLVVRGALSDAAQISAAEAYVNSKTGAF